MKLKLSALAFLLASANLSAQTEVRLAVHKSFSLPQSVLAQFEKANDAKVSVIKAGRLPAGQTNSGIFGILRSSTLAVCYSKINI